MPDALPVEFVFALYRGDDRVWHHAFTDDNHDPIDLTGWVFAGQYRATPDASAALAHDSFAFSGPPSAGILVRTLSAVQAALLPAGRVAWDLQATKPDGTVRTYLYCDRVAVRGDVTRS